MSNRWYAAHILMYVKFKDGVQDTYPVWENIALILAESPEEASQKAQSLGTSAEGDSSGSLYWDERPATLVCAGIRKVIECQNPHSQPGDGVEISYSQFQVHDEWSLQKLACGEPIDILYVE